MRILTLDVGGTNIKSAVIDDGNRLTTERTTPTLPSKEAAQASLLQSAIAVAKTYTDYDILSVSMTGQIEKKTQSLLFDYNRKEHTDSQGFPVGALLREAVGRPVYLINDANAAALGEAYFGAGRGFPDFLCLTYGTGVGGGIVQNGQLLTGAWGIAGEFGHIVTHAGGKLCGCGYRGCYERYASTKALLTAAKKICPTLENAHQLFEAAEADAALRRVIHAWEREIVEGLCTLTYIFNPSCFILGGGVMEREDVLHRVRERFFKRVIRTFGNVQILKAQLGNRAGMYGAAVYARMMTQTNS